MGTAGNRTPDKWERWAERRVRSYVFIKTKREICKYLMFTFCGNIFHCETTRTERGVIGDARESNGDFVWIW